MPEVPKYAPEVRPTVIGVTSKCSDCDWQMGLQGPVAQTQERADQIATTHERETGHAVRITNVNLNLPR